MALKFKIKSILKGTVLVVARKLIVDEVQAIEIVNINPWTEL